MAHQRCLIWRRRIFTDCLEHATLYGVAFLMNRHAGNFPSFRRAGHLLFFLVIWMASLARGSTLWTGPLIMFNQPTPDSTQSSNQDRLTPDVFLTRTNSQGLFNAVTETKATTPSPADTTWAMGDLTNFSALTFQTWLTMLNGASPTNLVGKQLVVHITSEDIYFSLEVTFWGSHASGGFTYQRSTPAIPLLTGASITNGQISFTHAASPGSSYVIQNSTDLTNWMPVITNVVTNVPAGTNIVFNQNAVSNGLLFFRVVRLPQN
jgi:hypothetical protein